MTTKKQLYRRDRNARIKATYESLPLGSWKLSQLAKLYGVSVSTAFYAINGRKKK